LILEK